MIYVVTNNEGKILPISKPYGGSGMSAPIGSITPGFTEDENWKYCEGQLLSKNDYPDLFNIIGYTYGGADEYFNLPDMREYAPCGAGKRASNTSEEMILGRCYESQFGSHTHSQAAHCHCRPAHSHTGNTHCHTIPSHCHSISQYCDSDLELYDSVYFGCTYCIARPNPTGLTNGTYGTVSDSDSIATSTNSDGNLNAATASNCATGSTSGGTHGRRYGMRYLVRVA